MNLDLINEVFNNLKENKIVQNFIKELSNYLEKNINNNSKLNYEWNNLLSDDLVLYGNRITTKYRDEMLIERNNILQKYAENTKEKGEMYYIYNISTSEKNSYNISILKENQSNEVITKSIEELPEESSLGSVLRKQGNNFILDVETTRKVQEEINNMIKEKIEEQNKYLNNKRINDHIYEVGEKYSGKIWLYDLTNVTGSGIEEVEFPKELYESAKEGDKFIYKNGEYQKYSQ